LKRRPVNQNENGKEARWARAEQFARPTQIYATGSSVRSRIGTDQMHLHGPGARKQQRYATTLSLLQWLFHALQCMYLKNRF
jgi:hypothetical protein